ncbi:DMT family transporter [Fulvivirga maritima]|uniref:DMT family transporter n=1 Tax=Fulvivirga maritima TaxID=2904247 RepID=UPI001F25FF48|nr:DMT family transporter [Fulvivirga maritima]UII26549.1 DMT family transporter [Fulvivirga maritima]
MKDKTHLQNLLMLNITMIIMSTSGALGRYIDMTPAATIWWRCILGTVFLYSFCKWKKVNIKINWAHDGWSIIIAGLLLGAHWLTYFYSLKLSNVAIGMLSLFTYPVITAFLEPIILKTKFELTHILLALLVLIGIYFLAPEFDLENDTTLGIICGVASSIFYTLRNILLKKKVERYAGTTLMLYQIIIIACLLWPVFFFYDISTIQTEWKATLALALITTSIGHTLFVSSFKKFSVTTVSIISGTQPIYGILLGFIFLNEVPQSSTMIGGALILTTVIIESMRTKKSS